LEIARSPEAEIKASFGRSAFNSGEDFRRFADSVRMSEDRLQFDPDAVNSWHWQPSEEQTIPKYFLPGGHDFCILKGTTL
jgi:hypothetical protein